MRLITTSKMPPSFEVSPDRTSIKVPLSFFSSAPIALHPCQPCVLRQAWPLTDLTEAGYKVMLHGLSLVDAMVMNGFVDDGHLCVTLMSGEAATITPETFIVAVEFFEPLKIVAGSANSKFGVLKLDAPAPAKTPKRRAKKSK